VFDVIDFMLKSEWQDHCGKIIKNLQLFSGIMKGKTISGKTIKTF